MKRDSLKAAAGSLARLEALEKALENVSDEGTHETIPVAFYGHGAHVFYPRADYIAVIDDLISGEEQLLSDLGVEL